MMENNQIVFIDHRTEIVAEAKAKYLNSRAESDSYWFNYWLEYLQLRHKYLITSI